ncbi:DNA polymerase III subunit gamma/tau [Helicobacter cholecystus]|uniref:DNA polymerase III subunit gamma/tau n=1 Tax=Helicobacter cholecystus TaxID=45498 RepID=A0A3D8IXN5_9HELI|nr:DNA polymerase III subunit gamma/tau [Helicobacter cholecystus]RDU69311.1 DNA polymerase III subunit gamma/tau [Helicobacter cholecystus]VEJ24388.1 DNA polymerase III subunits gamma and tau [Helicobacter cholecystus]
MSLALKYRPKFFRDLIGQESVSQTLSLALDSQKIGNAYLFSGLRGSGKTSSARIFARSLQCEKGPSSDPCGECANCKASLEGRHIDIIEMDAASNRRIDDIRELIEQTKYNPSMGRYKIFIIDEIHMLTKEAFNALLKTLEEPPERVKFILATTDPLLVPATILSRTQHFRFKKISHKLVVNHIASILQNEGIGYDLEALEVIARSGEGSLRDTLTLLDQAILYGGNYVGTQSTISMLGIINPEILESFFLSILQRNEDKTQEIVSLMREYECEMIIDEMMIFLKDKALSNQEHFPPLLLNRFFFILTQAKTLLSLNTHSEFVLLLCIMKFKEALKLRDISSYIQELEQKVNIPPSSSSYEGLQDSKPSSTSQMPQNIISQPEQKEESKPRGEREFALLKQCLYDRSYTLGEIFEKNFLFCSYIHHDLVLQSQAVGEEREELAKNWKLIKGMIKECFGEGVNIIFTQEEKPQMSQVIGETQAVEVMQKSQAVQESQIIEETSALQELQIQMPQPVLENEEVEALQTREAVQIMEGVQKVGDVQEATPRIEAVQGTQMQPTKEIEPIQESQSPYNPQNTQEAPQPPNPSTTQLNPQEIMQRNQDLFATLQEHLEVNLSDVKIIQHD